MSPSVTHRSQQDGTIIHAMQPIPGLGHARVWEKPYAFQHAKYTHVAYIRILREKFLGGMIS
eukprot:scaffold57967_cov14-Tisochrysis_lutea.AAC.1